MIVDVVVDTHLRFKTDGLQEELLQMLMDALTAISPDEPEDSFIMWGQDLDGNFVAPRGFAIKLVKGFAAYGHSVAWIDRRVIVPGDFSFNLQRMPRPYQASAIMSMKNFEQGIYEAPPGSGKTISTALYIAAARQRTIILVNKINIATQWQERIWQTLGYEAGIIGDQRWEERDITIAVWQTLWSKRHELQMSPWVRQWGSKVLDECHAISSPSIRDIWQWFPARDSIGLSATPDRHGWLEIASRSMIGEIFHRTTDFELEQAGVLIRPQVYVVKTDFEFDWKSRGDKKRQYQTMTKELKYDRGRNQLFASIIAQQRGHTSIVHTAHKTQAHELAAYALANGWPAGRVLMLTGDEKDWQRTEVLQKADGGDIVIFTTIGAEAVDIPRLDRFFLVWPTKNDAMVKQMIGRLRRTHETKTTAPIFYDFWDHRIYPLNKQYADRRTLYAREQLPLTVLP